MEMMNSMMEMMKIWWKYDGNKENDEFYDGNDENMMDMEIWWKYIKGKNTMLKFIFISHHCFFHIAIIA